MRSFPQGAGEGGLLHSGSAKILASSAANRIVPAITQYLPHGERIKIRWNSLAKRPGFASCRCMVAGSSVTPMRGVNTTATTHGTRSAITVERLLRGKRSVSFSYPNATNVPGARSRHGLWLRARELGRSYRLAQIRGRH
jgi:hypothetical protein